MAYIRTLYFPRNSFDNPSLRESPDDIVKRMVSMVVRLEELVVYGPFSPSGLASWLSLVGMSLSQLELRMDNLAPTISRVLRFWKTSHFGECIIKTPQSFRDSKFLAAPMQSNFEGLSWES